MDQTFSETRLGTERFCEYANSTKCFVEKKQETFKISYNSTAKTREFGPILDEDGQVHTFFRRFTFPYFPVHNHRLCLPAPRSTIFKFYHYLMEKVPHLKMTDRAKWTL